MIFIDTGAFIARYLTKDSYHTEAIKIWRNLEIKHKKLFTSNFVLDETFTLLARFSHTKFAYEKAHLIYATDIISILRPDHEVEVNALHWFDKYAEHKVSFTDCISFQLIRQYNIKEVFTFDKHFKIAGFKIAQC